MTSPISRRTGALSILALTLACLPLTTNAMAQDNTSQAADPVNPCARFSPSEAQTHTYYLTNVTQPNDANEIMVAIRNLVCPGVHIYLVASQNAVVVEGAPSQLAIAEKIIHDLDRPRKSYRLVYTITELDGDKTISTQHMSMVAVIGQRTSVKEGDKVPLATGTTGENNSTQTQFTYIDVGMNFDATIEEQNDGVSLKSKVEQSSVGPTNTIAGVAEPVIRQTVLEGFSLLTLNKPVMLGSIDVPTTTHRFDIAVVLQAIK